MSFSVSCWDDLHPSILLQFRQRQPRSDRLLKPEFTDHHAHA
ncbi:MAG: hypothetical protein VX420_09310 [SAR324 cluster bacterium]|nr:hypothetical protein [SAR324 cluster bacterium]